MLEEYYPHCMQKKHCKCKMVDNIDNKKIPLEFRPIQGDDNQAFYIAQRRPWDPRQGISLDPLSFSGTYLNSYTSGINGNPHTHQNFEVIHLSFGTTLQILCPINKTLHLNGKNSRGIGNNL